MNDPANSPTVLHSPLLEVRDLAVSFSRERGAPVSAVRDVGFSIHPGQTVALVGESGSGKSVTALSILRLLPTPPAVYERGSILLRESGAQSIDIFGSDDATLRHVRGGKIAMIFQEPMTSLNPVMEVGEQIVEAAMLHQRLSAREARDAAIEAMTQVGIVDAAKRFRSFPHQFSGGMRQRVMIAMALACRPAMLIADEPTTALDVTVQARILDLIAELKAQRNLAVLLITHDLGLVADRADFVCVMYGGTIVEAGATTDVLAAPMHPYTQALLASRPSLATRGRRLATVAESLADPARCTTDDPDIRMWWPHHTPAQGAQGNLMIQAGEGRWLRAWRTDAAVVRAARTLPAALPRPASPVPA